MNWIRLYVDEIDKGLIVGKKVERIYRRLLEEIDNGKYVFDETRGERPIRFAETFCVPKDSKTGKPIQLDLFQKAFIQASFGILTHEGKRRFKEILLLVARKNGKTTLLAILMLYMLVADGENGAECYVVATKLEQSRKTFIECQAIVSKSPELRALLKKRQSDIFNPKTFGFLKALASDSSTLDGLNSYLVTIDELHEIKEKQLYEVMKQSTSSRDEPMLFMITTAGTRRASIFDEIYKYANEVLNGTVEDDRFLPVLYEMDERLEYLEPKMWFKSNPGLGTIKKVEYLQEAVERAKNDASRQSGVLTKDFNLLGVTDTAWLPFDVINNEATYTMSDIEDTYAIGGADLSSTTDLTCATLLIIRDTVKYVLQMYFIPSERLQEKIKEDGVRYDLWEERGLVRVCDGAKVNYSDVTAWFVEMREKHKIYPLWIGYDRWNANYWVDEMKGNGFNMEDVIQGAITMSNPMKELNADLIQKKLNYNNNPILKWCFTNTSIKVDDNENIRPVKGREQKKRIDGVVSLIDAYVVYMRHIDDYSNMQS